MPPPKNFHWHDILDMTGFDSECISCGAPNNAPIYRSDNDVLYWEYCWDVPLDAKKYTKSLEDAPERKGYKRTKVLVIQGLCRTCTKLPNHIKYRGVFGWNHHA